jgi:hypothetical protein
VEIVVNGQNLIVDIHLLGETDHHRIMHGVPAQPRITIHEKALIRTADGKEESPFVRPLPRSKVVSVPVGAHAIFLSDERQGVAVVTYGSKEAVAEAQLLWQKKSPLKANFKKVTGLILQTIQHETIIIQTHEVHVHSLQVRPLALKKLINLPKGNMVVLFVDVENKVTDVSCDDPEHQR